MTDTLHTDTCSINDCDLVVEVRRSKPTRFCAIHKCKSCDQRNVFDRSFCLRRTYLSPNCTMGRVDRASAYCKDHECVVLDCLLQALVVGGRCELDHFDLHRMGLSEMDG
jgi:hypothetical protein